MLESLLLHLFGEVQGQLKYPALPHALITLIIGDPVGPESLLRLRLH